MRGSGRTTKQLEDIIERAREGDAIAFVWPHAGSLHYPSDIVARLAPDALRSEQGRSFVFPGGGRVRVIPPAANTTQFWGTLFEIVFDHATWDLPTAAIAEMLDAMQNQAQRRAIIGGRLHETTQRS